MFDTEGVTRPTVDTRLLAFVEAYRNQRRPNSMPISVSASSSVPPRFLFVDNHAGEFLHYRIQLAYAMRRAGFEVHVAVPTGNAVGDIAREGLVVHTFYLRRLSMHAGDEIRACLSLFRVYHRVKPFVAHHFCLKPAVYGGLVARIVGVPAMVTTLTGLGYAFTGRTVSTWMARLVVTRALRLVFGHHNHRLILQNKDDLTTLTAKRVVDEHHAVVINGSGVDLGIFRPAPEAAGPAVVLMACRLLWEKGVAEFVAAAHALRARGAQARFVLVGEPDHGHPSAVPVSLLNLWNDSGDVEWLGWSDDMPELIRKSHVVCLPSYYGEGVPRILIQAAASGRPIVTTNSPGCREVVRDRENGFLVPPQDSGALVDAIATLLDSPSLRLTMGKRGRERAVEEFGLARATDANVEVYCSLLNSRDRSSIRASISP